VSTNGRVYTCCRATTLDPWLPSRRSARCTSSALPSPSTILTGCSRRTRRFRALAHISGHSYGLRSRNGHTFKQWPQLCEELAHAGRRTMRLSTARSSASMRGAGATSRPCCSVGSGRTFYAFDLLAVDGEDLQDWPLVERKRRLRRLIPSVRRGSCRGEGMGRDAAATPRRVRAGRRVSLCLAPVVVW
jgi:hypothetical protein